MATTEEGRLVGGSDWSQTELPAAFFDAFFAPTALEPTQALIEAAGRMRVLVQRS